MEAPGRIGLVLVGAAAAVLAAGCGGPDEVPEYDAAPADESGDGTDEASPDTSLAVREGTGIGDVVTDADGYTLYMYTQDGSDPPTATCAGDCARQWPPALDEGGAPPEGIDADLVGSVERDDGEAQLTLDGWPLYRYAGDVEPGDVNGEGAGGLWHAVAPGGGKAAEAGGGEGGEGAPAEETPADEPPGGDSSPEGGYDPPEGGYDDGAGDGDGGYGY